MSQTFYIMVELTAHVSLSGLPVLTTLYKLILMHKKTKSQNCEFCVEKKIVAFKKECFFNLYYLWGNSIKKVDLLVKS